ncbi:alpha-2,3 sialyltransferase [Campylobacter lari]|uniref:alpha-2,3-sialyltransferase n=1 Tax=Campylobacter lari TaxID=201 RepID=UPI0017F36924|nr:alpha-2,3-sialyltransferase [Campylobacter lari]EAI4827343.1 alpha-2,3-sialyltransferase [Campylobacter lari]EAJ1119405.1 alpha-2,3-sialyltransferase [Campylobacter lari]MCV3399751.1 alpha-2,3 sialyltransferase [Campylobacter lari]MCW0226128.1 alpha-2,3-sialyltransferase [Campylobacter lari]MCW0242575.1 alpha-2,3-sialyltransferase [Campylobacter lari]
MNNAVVVAGNGPSVKEIDYSLLPNDYDVFRCNHFYLEDRYYLGKKIKACFFIAREFFEQYYMMQKLIQNGDYECEDIVCKMYNFQDRKEEVLRENFKYFFPMATNGYDAYFSKLKYLSAAIDFDVCYNFERVEMLTGTYAICCAVASGYKEIYLAGMDFYEQGNSHFYSNYKMDLKETVIHHKNKDIEIINFLQKKYNVKIYSICPKSPINNFIPLAKGINNNIYKPIAKPQEAIKNKLLPSEKAIKRYKRMYLLSNSFVKFVYDILKTPSAIKKYLSKKYSR